MARFTGPKHKLSRRVGYDIWGGSKGPAAKRPYPPGQHGNNVGGSGGKAGGRRNTKQSNYARHLLEKQKLRHYYGMLERQFRNTYKKATRMRGVKGDNFLSLLESRLDSVVYRSRFVPTIFAARQLVAHGHFLVNGKKVDCPSFQVKPGHVVTLREKSRNIPVVKESIEDAAGTPIPAYLNVSHAAFEVKLNEAPPVRDIPIEIDTALVVEFYSR